MNILYRIPDPMVIAIASCLASQLQKEVEVIEMDGRFSHEPQKVKVYIQLSSDWYHLYFLDAKGGPCAIYLQTETCWIEEGLLIQFHQLLIGTGLPGEEDCRIEFHNPRINIDREMGYIIFQDNTHMITFSRGYKFKEELKVPIH